MTRHEVANRENQKIKALKENSRAMTRCSAMAPFAQRIHPSVRLWGLGCAKVCWGLVVGVSLPLFALCYMALSLFLRNKSLLSVTYSVIIVFHIYIYISLQYLIFHSTSYMAFPLLQHLFTVFGRVFLNLLNPVPCRHETQRLKSLSKRGSWREALQVLPELSLCSTFTWFSLALF